MALLNARATTVEAIWRCKRGLELPIHDPERERHVLDNVAMSNHGPLTEQRLLRIYENILGVSGSQGLGGC